MNEQLSIKKVGEKDHIFDLIRKKYVLLTPEEWVRQQFLRYMVYVKNYPASLIAVERIVKIAGVSKRFDILIYRDALPWMLVECKNEAITLNHQILSQILAYQSVLQVKYLTVTNGKHFFCFDIEQHLWQTELPEFR